MLLKSTMPHAAIKNIKNTIHLATASPTLSKINADTIS